jgi:hypothetical protein
MLFLSSFVAQQVQSTDRDPGGSIISRLDAPVMMFSRFHHTSRPQSVFLSHASNEIVTSQPLNTFKQSPEELPEARTTNHPDHSNCSFRSTPRAATASATDIPFSRRLLACATARPQPTGQSRLIIRKVGQGDSGWTSHRRATAHGETHRNKPYQVIAEPKSTFPI